MDDLKKLALELAIVVARCSAVVEMACRHRAAIDLAALSREALGHTRLAAALLYNTMGSAARARAPDERSMPAAPGRAVVGDSETRGGFLLLAAAVLADARLENSSPSGATYVQRPPLLRDAVQPDGRPFFSAASALWVVSMLILVGRAWQCFARCSDERVQNQCSGESRARVSLFATRSSASEAHGYAVLSVLARQL